MAGRIDLVRGMKQILGDRYFVYGGYESRPDSTVYGNYAEIPGDDYFADDKRLLKVRHYIVRLVTDHKDFVLEDTIETLFDTLDIAYQQITHEYVKVEKSYCTEWEVVILEPR